MPHTPDVHHLQVAPEVWTRIAAGLKTFDVRYNDRGIRTGDIVHYHRSDESRDGITVLRQVTFVLPGGVITAGRVLVDPSAVILAIAPFMPPASPMSIEAKRVEHLTHTLRHVLGGLVAIKPYSDPTQVTALIEEIMEALDLTAPPLKIVAS